MTDTELLDKLESLFKDPSEKLLMVRDGDFVNDNYDLREWIEKQPDPKRKHERHEKSELRAQAMREAWARRKARNGSAEVQE